MTAGAFFGDPIIGEWLVALRFGYRHNLMQGFTATSQERLSERALGCFSSPALSSSPQTVGS